MQSLRKHSAFKFIDSSPTTDDTSGLSPAQNVTAVVYIAGGIFGVTTSLPHLNAVSLDLMSGIAWMILLAQIAAALCGGWQLWNMRIIGAQILFWLSLSCVPVISFSLLSYWCAMGLGIFPTFTIGSGLSGTNFNVQFGYASQLIFNGGDSGLMIVANLIALIFVAVLGKALNDVKVAKWPLAWIKS